MIKVDNLFSEGEEINYIDRKVSWTLVVGNLFKRTYLGKKFLKGNLGNSWLQTSFMWCNSVSHSD